MKTLPFVLALGIAAGIAAPAAARDQIRIVGSSTVYPFSTAVAEQFGRRGKFKTPVVESTGTGGGIKLFCSGVGDQTPDIANASRRMKDTELASCQAAGVKEVVEVKIGYDGIVIANAKKAKPVALKKQHIFLALAKQVPKDGKLVANPYKKWSEIDPSLPAIKIEVLGPPPTSGTRDAFVELAMEGGAKTFPMLAALKEKDENAFKAAAHAIREDGHYVEAGENDNLIVQKLVANPNAFGVFGYSFLEENTDKVRGNAVDGVAPSFDAIADGKYGISRALFFYVKKAHVGKVPGLKEFIAAFMSPAAASEDGYLADKGLIPLAAAERAAVVKSATALTAFALK
ncbi:MAG: PstS family phosphate ABC transporter substrate-binding protein [Deltaproteobacteria bacterium]|nr:PstS family phosphate ABC transporter substrate-binding protein [Deltaproteobacteria bacterium]